MFNRGFDKHIAALESKVKSLEIEVMEPKVYFWVHNEKAKVITRKMFNNKLPDRFYFEVTQAEFLNALLDTFEVTICHNKTALTIKKKE